MAAIADTLNDYLEDVVFKYNTRFAYAYIGPYCLSIHKEPFIGTRVYIHYHKILIGTILIDNEMIVGPIVEIVQTLPFTLRTEITGMTFAERTYPYSHLYDLVPCPKISIINYGHDYHLVKLFHDLSMLINGKSDISIDKFDCISAERIRKSPNLIFYVKEPQKYAHELWYNCSVITVVDDPTAEMISSAFRGKPLLSRMLINKRLSQQL